MKQKTNKMLIFTSLAAYFTYFIHGIGASILGQYKPEFAAAWGAKPLADGTLDVSMVVSVIAALGLGRLISLPFSGPLSDKYGRKLSGIIGVLCYVAYFFGMANSTSMAMGYAFAVIGGIANSFLDTCVSPTCMEIYVNNPSVANLFTKFSICLSQFLLPFLIGIVASANMSYKTIFIVAGIAILIDGILILILPFPAREKAVQAKADKKKSGHKISPAAIAAILIGLKEKKYDLGFCSKLDNEPLIEFIPVARQELVVIVPLDHPLAVKDEVRLEDTIPYKQIIFKKRSGLRQIIDGLFECIGQTPDVAYEIDEDQVAAGFVSNGFGICVAPNIPILQSLNVKILPLVSPSWQRNFYMAMLKNVYHPPVVEAFKKYVIEQAQKEWDYKTS